MKVNKHLLFRIQEKNQEIEKIKINPRETLVLVKNPVLELFRRGSITKEQADAALFLQIQFEKSMITNHSRPSYEQRGASTQNFAENFFFTKFKSVNEYLLKVRTAISAMSILHVKILDEIIINQNSLRRFIKKYHTNHERVLAHAKEVFCVLEKI